MPRNVRNFWIDLDVDGSKKRIGTGPRNKDGGFNLTIKQRNAGGIVTSCEIIGRATTDGQIVLSVRANGEQLTTQTIR